MFFCHFPALVEATTLVHADWNNRLLGESMHVINAYISLLPTHQRRHVLISKAKEETAAAQAAATALVQSPCPAKKPKAGPVASGSMPLNQRFTQPPRVSQEDQMREELANLRRMVQRLQGQALPNPPLPATKPPVWPSKDQGPDLPDDF